MTPSAIPLAFVALVGCATPHAISGKVIDRNGDPVQRAIISIAPGNVELVTDQSGQFVVDYLRDETGERVKLGKRADYSVEVFKPGYHIGQMDFYYKRGELYLEPITVAEDTIRISGSDENIDPGLYPDRTQSSGAAYEGE